MYRYSSCRLTLNNSMKLSVAFRTEKSRLSLRARRRIYPDFLKLTRCHCPSGSVPVSVYPVLSPSNTLTASPTNAGFWWNQEPETPLREEWRDENRKVKRVQARVEYRQVR